MEFFIKLQRFLGKLKPDKMCLTNQNKPNKITIRSYPS